MSLSLSEQKYSFRDYYNAMPVERRCLLLILKDSIILQSILFLFCMSRPSFTPSPLPSFPFQWKSFYFNSPHLKSRISNNMQRSLFWIFPFKLFPMSRTGYPSNFINILSPYFCIKIWFIGVRVIQKSNFSNLLQKTDSANTTILNLTYSHKFNC
jgi:hypothetical protein